MRIPCWLSIASHTIGTLIHQATRLPAFSLSSGRPLPLCFKTSHVCGIFLLLRNTEQRELLKRRFQTKEKRALFHCGLSDSNTPSVVFLPCSYCLRGSDEDTAAWWSCKGKRTSCGINRYCIRNAPAPHPVEVSLYQTQPPPPANMPECTAEMWSKMMVMLQAYEAEKVQSSHQSPKSSKGSVERVATYEPTALYIL